MTAKKPRALQNNRCKVCCLPASDQAVLERLYVTGSSFEALSERYGMSRWAISRHCRAHLTKERRIELMAGPVKLGELVNRAAEESNTVLEMFAVERSLLFSRMLSCAESGDTPGLVSTSRALTEVLDKLARITGELRELSGLTINNNTQINIASAPEFVALSTGLLELGRRYPEAKQDIITLLRGLETEPTTTGLDMPPSRC